MKTILIIATTLLTLSACTPVRAVGDVAVGTGKVVLGAADLVI